MHSHMHKCSIWSYSGQKTGLLFAQTTVCLCSIRTEKEPECGVYCKTTETLLLLLGWSASQNTDTITGLVCLYYFSSSFYRDILWMSLIIEFCLWYKEWRNSIVFLPVKKVQLFVCWIRLMSADISFQKSNKPRTSRASLSCWAPLISVFVIWCLFKSEMITRVCIHG